MILTHQADRRLRVMLNRPEKANAITHQMLRDLAAVFQAAAQDASLRAVVITGAGDRVFCAGADLSELSSDRNDPSVALWDGVTELLDRLPLLTLALVNGPCIGGGMTLALGCDIRIGVPEARFQYPALKNGVFPGRRDVGRLRSLIGDGHMAALLLGGHTVASELAVSWGLLDQVVPRADLAAAADRMTETACVATRDHLIAMKRLCRGEGS